MATTRLTQVTALPDPAAFGPGAVLLYDRRLGRHVPGFAAWRQQFPAQLGVNGGEALKAVDAFPEHITRLVALTSGFSRREAVLVCAGGGSVGDFGGFAASVLQRGIGLVHVPSTWLAAVDSAHGGKTALNVGGAKNPIGTFHAARSVVLVRDLLFSQPALRARDGLGEMVKMALLDGGAWTRRLFAARQTGAELLWRFLRPAIRAKEAVVASDPFELNGKRQVLNLGHTLGHVIEAHHGLSHGRAVARGLHFTLAWSRARARLTGADCEAFVAHVTRLTGETPHHDTLPPIPRRRFLSLLARDKKGLAGADLTFVFLAGLGRPVRRRVTREALVAAAAAEGWVR